MERIDKIISKELNIGRNDAKSLIKSGKVFLNGSSVKSPSEKLDEEKDVLTVGGRVIHLRRFVYIMMNKPEGVISSTDGRKTSEKTVIDILPEDMKRKNLFPAGRLDKNTTGFVLITDDGEFAHRILSPRSHVPKTYIAKLDKPFDDEISDAFSNGITIGDDECLPAVLEPVPLPSLPNVTLPAASVFLYSLSIIAQHRPSGGVCTFPLGAIISYIWFGR